MFCARAGGSAISIRLNSVDVIRTGKTDTGATKSTQGRSQEAKRISRTNTQTSVSDAVCALHPVELDMTDQRATPAIPLRAGWTAESEFVAPAAPDTIRW